VIAFIDRHFAKNRLSPIRAAISAFRPFPPEDRGFPRRANLSLRALAVYLGIDLAKI
jgi:hypothetical protein